MTYCADCGCPTCCHDETGVCRALDMPGLGIVADCVCGGLK